MSEDPRLIMDKITRIEQLLPQLEEQERRRILNKALTAGAMRIKDSTVSLLKQRLPASTNGKKYGKPMTSGVRMKKNPAYLETMVHIMGEFKLKWFEKGTKVRKTKSGANRGQIKALNFFKDAKMNESDVSSAIVESFERSIKR